MYCGVTLVVVGMMLKGHKLKTQIELMKKAVKEEGLITRILTHA